MLVPGPVKLPDQVVGAMQQLALIGTSDKAWAYINDPYESFDFYPDLGGIFYNYDNKDVAQKGMATIAFPVYVYWGVEEQEGKLFQKPLIKAANHREAAVAKWNFGVNNYVAWCREIEKILPQFGFTSGPLKVEEGILCVPAAPWSVDKEDFYCLESEVGSLVSDYVNQLISLLASKG